MRFDIRYRTLFSYTELVSESQNELRACPTNDDCQRLLDYRVSVHPTARVFSYMDSWGTRVDSFGLRRPHLAMEVVAEAAVETRPRPLPSTTPPVSALEGKEFIDGHFEFLQSDRHTTAGPRVVEAAQRQLAAAGPDLVEVIFYVHRFVGGSVRYLPGSTPVGIEVEHVLESGEGVCQDFAHLAVAMCRSIGIPARYVSGYLFTDDDSSGLESVDGTVKVQTHAWIEAAIPGWGWLALDPTNGQAVGERHVKIGHGVSYEDVQPLRGVFLGPATSQVQPDVEIRKVSGSDLWRPSSLVSNDGFTGAPSSHRGPGHVPPGAVPNQSTQQ
jgi:transglutaminase-like putative cysteine protease